MEILAAVVVAFGIGWLWSHYRKPAEGAGAESLPAGLPPPRYALGVTPYAEDCDVPGNPPAMAPALGAPIPGAPTRGPTAGIASNMLHQWCWKVQDGDTAGNLAEQFVGNRSRYVELIAANPSKPQITDPELNFAHIDIGETLFLPKSWNPWIDELGRRTGKPIPFPPYDKLPPYPVLPMGKLYAGMVPWPPGAPSTWVEIPTGIPSDGGGS